MVWTLILLSPVNSHNLSDFDQIFCNFSRYFFFQNSSALITNNSSIVEINIQKYVIHLKQ
jgi:hypothetical protein